MAFGAFAFTGVATGSWAAWQHIAQGARRADGFAPLHPILYGNLSLSVGLIYLAGLAWAWRCHQRYRWLLFCGLGALDSLCCVTAFWYAWGLGGVTARGVVFYRVYLRAWSRGWHALLLASIAMMALAFMPCRKPVSRSALIAVEEGQSYLAGEAYGSVGVR